MEQIKLALDWSPNTNHIGFFVAQAKGFYTENKVAVEILDPSADNYQTTPAKKVELGLADFALCPMESIISYRTKSNPFPLTAVAAVLQEDLSAIAVREDAEIYAPKDLDGKIYASYKARYEDEIIRQMIKNDGGKGEIKIDYPDKLGIWETIVSRKSDATWIFLNWESVEAEMSATKLRYFKMKDYHIPYSYSPVIATSKANIETKSTAYKNFLAATKKGYLFSKNNPEEATSILQKHLPERDKNIDLNKTLAMSVAAFGDENTWGKMATKNVKTFIDWIYEKQLETIPVNTMDLFTNELLDYTRHGIKK